MTSYLIEGECMQNVEVHVVNAEMGVIMPCDSLWP